MKYLRWFCFFVTILAVFLLTPKNSFATNYDMATTGNWNIRIDGAAGSDGFSQGGIFSGDLDNNSNNDLVVLSPGTDFHSRSNSGSVYVIYDSVYSSLTGTGNTIDTADSSKWNLRIDGPIANGFNNTSSGSSARVRIADMDGDGKQDLLIAVMLAANNSRTQSGSLYILYNTLLDDYSGTGNLLDLATSTNYSVRIDGAAASDLLTVWGGFSQPIDIGTDGDLDLMLGATGTDYNSRSASGSIYLIDNDILPKTGTGNDLDLAQSTNFSTRIDGPLANLGLGGSYTFLQDMTKDGLKDLVVSGHVADYNSRSGSGSVWIIPNSVFSGLTGTGNTIDMGPTTNWFLRVDGAAASNQMGESGQLAVGDVDNDSYNDLLIGVDNYSSSTGAIFIILSSLLDDYSGTGNLLDLANSAHYSLRVDGTASSDNFSFQGFALADYFSMGKLDLVAPGWQADNNGRDGSGSGYIINNAILNDNLTGTGSSISLTDASSYSLRFDGASAGDRIAMNIGSLFDVNNDSKSDVLFSSYLADTNSRADSGSVYLIYNFPHSITINNTTAPAPNTAFNVTGSVSASNSVTNISGVEYRLDDNTPSASWTACTADDGSFDSTSETFTCSVPAQDDYSPHAVYIRAYDANTSYTAQSNYGSFSFQIPAPLTAPNTPGSDPYIAPAEAPSVESGGGGTISSSPNSSVIIQEGAVPFALDVSHTLISSHDTPFGVQSARCGVGDIHEIWLTDYYNKARILPSVQNKPSIVALRYNTFQLLTAGGGMISERSLRLAYSSDGTRWTVLPTSVVDTVNNTVAALHKVGGYYMITSCGGGGFTQTKGGLVQGVSAPGATQDLPSTSTPEELSPGTQEKSVIQEESSVSVLPQPTTSEVVKRNNLEIFVDFIRGSLNDVIQGIF